MSRVFPISVCLIVKNEEAYLDACLKSVKNHVHEIIVVDTGSTDRTVEIAQANGAKVSHFEWIGDFAAARNESISKASCPFILQLDADEEIMPESWNWFLKEYPFTQADGYYCLLENLRDAAADEILLTHKLIRFYRNHPDIRYRNKIHENIIIASNKTRASDIRILHKGYGNQTVNEKKIKRNLDLLLTELKENPYDPYTHYYLSQSYSALQRSFDAYKACMKSLKLGICFPVRAHAYRIVLEYQATHALEKEFAQTETTIASESVFPEIIYYRAILAKRLGDTAKAKELLLQFVHIAENPPKGKFIGEESYIVLANYTNALAQLAFLAQAESDIPTSLEFLYKAVELSPMSSVLYSIIARSELLMNNKNRAIMVLEQAIEIFEKQLMNLKQKELIGNYQRMIDKIKQTL